MIDFNIHRFRNVAEWSLINSKGTLIKKFFGIYFTLFFFMMFFSRVGGDGDVVPVLTTVMGSVFLVISGGAIVGNMKTKQQRISYMMLPGSTLEKFAANYLMVTVGSILLLAVGIVAADVSQWLLNSAIDRTVSNSYIIDALWHSNSNLVIKGDRMTLGEAILILYFWGHSLYMVGGALIRKHACLVTTAIIFAVTTCLSIVAVWIGGKLCDYGYAVYFYDSALTNILTDLGFFVVILFNYYLSYRIMGRIQVINNKWINL
ncbi:hypothetical protein [Segatella albensis]|uniref:hypothetical protein n=1 Tax=Segatella albensis TaxID=77768 RepID=UPI00042317EC|nr:hypothetical protein [Segatella albensis]